MGLTIRFLDKICSLELDCNRHQDLKRMLNLLSARISRPLALLSSLSRARACLSPNNLLHKVLHQELELIFKQDFKEETMVRWKGRIHLKPQEHLGSRAPILTTCITILTKRRVILQPLFTLTNNLAIIPVLSRTSWCSLSTVNNSMPLPLSTLCNKHNSPAKDRTTRRARTCQLATLTTPIKLKALQGTLHISNNSTTTWTTNRSLRTHLTTEILPYPTPCKL